jgi:multiple sugar transport system substrate-binding protein
MAAGSAHKDLAWRFMRHCAKAEMDKLTTDEGAIGVRHSTWADAEINRRIPFFHQLEALHAQAREMPRHPRLAEISHAVDRMITAAVTGDEASAALLARAQHEIEAIVR